jgi:hypothetical protein
MKLPLMVIILIGMVSLLSAYQNSSFSLVTPTELFAKEGELSLAHRFYGTVSDTPLAPGSTYNVIFAAGNDDDFDSMHNRFASGSIKIR